jgi:hypothetical protein
MSPSIKKKNITRHKKHKRGTRKRYRRTKVQRGGNPEQKYIFIDLAGGGGLGNQLYFFATGIMLQKKIKLPLCFMPSHDNPHSNVDYSKVFGVKLITELGISPDRVKAASDALPNKDDMLNVWGVDDIVYDNSNGDKDVTTKKVNYQNYVSVKDAIPEVRKSLMNNEFNKDKYKHYTTKVKSDESIFMHVRRGDYLKTNWQIALDYFLSALDIIDKVDSVKTIYIFSDDIEWVKTHDSKLKEHTKKTLNYDTPKDELEALYMMMLCTGGAIISNSTFSSWGAFMGADMNPNSTIVYPVVSLQHHNNDNPHDFPEKWKGIRCWEGECKQGKQGMKITKGGQSDSKCVYLDLGGGMGLGNQMWVYAAGVASSIRSGIPLCILPSSNNPHSKTDYRSIFNLGTPVERESVKTRLNAAKTIYGNIDPGNPHNNVLVKKKNVPSNKSSNLKMPSHWFQNYSAVISAIPLIREDMKKTLKEKYPDLEGTVADKDTTLFVHVRKGDYGMSTPPDSYFQKALDIVNGSEKISTVYMISDDIPYCKSRFDAKVWNTTKKLLYFDDPDEIKTMYLMSLCKGGAIISNSTFSSWGAILGADERPDSIIIYPIGWVTGDSSRIKFPAPVGNKWMRL